MPLDVTCPSCRASFPVVNAGRSFHVECPACDAGIGVAVEPSSGKIGDVPRFAVELAAPPISAQLPSARPRKRGRDDDDEPRRKATGGAGWGVLVGSGIGLVVVLIGLATTGYFLFTNLDTDDDPSPTRPVAAGPVQSAPPPRTTTKGMFGPPPGVRPAPNIFVKPAPTAVFPINPPEVEGVTIKLPAPVETVRVGGGGRFLVIATMPTPATKLLVFDLSLARVTAQIELDVGRSLIAAGMNKVVVANPNRGVFRHYKLPDLTADGESPIPPMNVSLTGMAMGSASNGPLFLSGVNEIVLYDTEARALVGDSRKAVQGPAVGPGGECRAAHDGHRFACTAMNWISTFALSGGQWQEARASMATVPVLGGTPYLYGEGQMYLPDGHPLGPNVSPPGTRSWLVPATHGTDFVRVTTGPPTATTMGRPSLSMTLHAGKNAAVAVAAFGDVPELQDVTLPMGGAQLDRQVFFAPHARALVVVPAMKDKLVMRRLDAQTAVAAPRAGQKGPPIVVKPAPVTPFDITPPEMDDDTAVVKLPGRVTAATVAGGGRFLLLTIPDTNKLHLFDFSAGRITAAMDHIAEGLSVVGGMNRVVVADKNQNILRFHTLPDLTADGVTVGPLPGRTIRGVALGTASNGPLIVYEHRELALLDLETRTTIPGSLRTGGGVPDFNGGRMYAAPDGSWFVWSGGQAKNVRVENGDWAFTLPKFELLAYPGGTDNLLYGRGQLYTRDLEPVGPSVATDRQTEWLLPATHGPLFLRTQAKRAPDNQGWLMTASVHADRDPVKPVLSGVEVGDVPPTVILGRPDLPPQQRVFLVPGAKLLAVIPAGNDKIVLRQLKLP